MIGKLFNNRYQIEEKLGAGGTAIVYRGLDLLLNRTVTVKILREEFANNQEFIRRFNHEAQAVASLSHPNIVSVYDVGTEGNLHYIVMEFVEGESLKDYINRVGVLPLGDACNIICQILSGLQHAHEHGIIHRDIKPHNILLGVDGRAKVTDFGIAIGLSDVTLTYNTTSRIMGSVHYISPEQVQGLGVTERSDIYSAGVVFYEMLTGRLPYVGETPISIAMQHVQGELVLPHRINPDIPDPVSYIVMRAMRKNPDTRYVSASDMGKAVMQAWEQINRPGAGRSSAENEARDSRDSRREEAVSRSEKEGRERLLRRKRVEQDSREPEEGAAEESRKTAADRLREVTENREKSARREKRREQEQKNEEKIPVLRSRSEDEQPRRRFGSGLLAEKSTAVRIGLIALAALLVIGVAWVAGNLFGVLSLNGNKAVVPQFVGMTLDEAQQAADDKDLILVVTERSSSTVEENIIIEQSVQANQEVSRGREIEVTVSTGREKVKVPAVETLSQRIAELTLANVGLTAQITTEYNAEVAKGLVIMQSPEAGSPVEPGSAVELLISLGAEPQKFSMASLLGKTLSDSQSYAAENGLNVSSVEYASSDVYGYGLVCAQSLSAGTTVQTGDELALTVSQGPGPTSKTYTLRYLLPVSGDTMLNVSVWVNDVQGSRELFNEQMKGGNFFSYDITYYNSGSFELRIDGSSVYSQKLE